MSEIIWRGLQIAAWISVAVAWWFNDAAGLKERMAIAETKIEQETRGYAVVQAELSRRLERVEDKLDKALALRGR